MLLKKIIKDVPSSISNINIQGLSSDSRKVKKNYIFFAIKGMRDDGEKYIKDAILNGAKIIICEQKSKYKNNKTIVLKIKNIKKQIVQACKIFYSKKPKNIIAVTGTNGKSSIAEFYYQILKSQKIPVASIGTLGIKINNKILKSNLTTLDTISLHQALSEIKKKGIENVILEASSHGLDQGRLDGIKFSTGIFTNFSQDHLDYHKTMSNYLNAKLLLFKKLLKKGSNIITNYELKEFSKIKKIAKEKKLKLNTIGPKNSTLEYNLIKNLENSQLVGIKYGNQLEEIKIPLIGWFQIKNICMSILAAKLSGVKLVKIFRSLPKIKTVNGRLQLIRVLPNLTKVFVDYAHTPDALKSSLEALSKHYNKKPDVVFGCGGDRDKMKRPIMARIAEENANKVYITDDNPRYENPKKIRKTLIKNFTKKFNAREIPDRAEAIKRSLIDSNFNNCVLIAGKGHETTQTYKNKIINFSDIDVIKKIRLKKLNYKKKNLNQLLNSELINTILNTDKDYRFEGVSINSKKIKKNNIFICIKGERFDGHSFIKEAFKNKANFCVSEKSINHRKIIKTKNSLNFLNKLAELKRDNSKAKIIAITGSSGKTTLKTFLGKTLSMYGRTYYSEKSYNNHYGVPLSLSNLESYHDYGVFEVGMSKAGEILKLSKIIKPDLVIITNIGEAHLENFKNINFIAKAKAEIIQNIRPGGFLLLNKDDKFFSFLSSLGNKRKLKIYSYGKSFGADARLISEKNLKNQNQLKIKVLNETITLKAKDVNELKIYNILALVLALKVLNLNLNKLKSNLNLESPEGRGRINKIKRFGKGFNLIDESYNANPSSIKNAINNFSKLETKNEKKYLLLGDMLELGKNSDFYHKNISKIVNQSNIDKLFVYGKNVFKTYQETHKRKQGNVLQNLSDFDEIFSELIKKNDYLMIKGSNATGLNKLSKLVISGNKNAL